MPTSYTKQIFADAELHFQQGKGRRNPKSKCRRLELTERADGSLTYRRRETVRQTTYTIIHPSGRKTVCKGVRY